MTWSQLETGAEDALIIAHAFRTASDDDTMLVMNAQSKRPRDLNQLEYFVIPAGWMRKAYPILTRNPGSAGGDQHAEPICRDWREKLGQIDCSPLLCTDDPHLQQNSVSTSRAAASREKPRSPWDNKNNAVSDDEENNHDEDKKRASVSRDMSGWPALADASKKKIILRRGLVHEQDFYLVGSNAWLLLKSKFGNDVEIARGCTFVNSRDRNLSVELYPAAPGEPPVYIPIPPTGRFAYEGSIMNGGVQIPVAAAAAAPPEACQDGNVTDDETTDYGDDLYPNQPSSQPILLLPPSTTGRVDGDRSDVWHSDNMDEDNTESASDVVRTTAAKRPYGAGLGNLGNTCFMNSTLQCLAHTDPLRNYFLSGEYEHDLNRDNPLGTGGELATQFSQLLGEMWRTSTTTRFGGYQSQYYSDSVPHVVYPRNFKYTLGKHAEQFMGYDQHDSQELATYLLDALHEDTNRVTKKPYVEKPEQSEAETDEAAANKAWGLHLKREDSRVLEMFMGQVKSRVNCSEDGCGRVSTTFDPFMFLSVPIPGSSERTISVTFVPLYPLDSAKMITLTVSKVAVMSDLYRKLREALLKHEIIDPSVSTEDFCAVDVWQNGIHKWYDLKSELERIKEQDTTFVYQLRPREDVVSEEQRAAEEAEKDPEPVALKEVSRTRIYQLDPATTAKLHHDEEWKIELERYIRLPTAFATAFHPTRGKTEDRVKLYDRLLSFISLCQRAAETAGQKRARHDSDESEENGDRIVVSSNEEPLNELAERSDLSTSFQNVKTRYDIAKLELIAERMRREIIQLEKTKLKMASGGVCVEIRMRKCEYYGASNESMASPLVLRIPSTMSVFGLRVELAKRLVRSLKTGRDLGARPETGQSTSERDIHNAGIHQPAGDDSIPHVQELDRFGSPELLLLRQVPLSYDSKRPALYSSSGIQNKLGSLDKHSSTAYGRSRPISLASPDDEDERAVVAHLVGHHGIIYMDWPSELAEHSFDVKLYEAVEEPRSMEEDAGIASRTRLSTKATTVLDCIEKFCQMEQLEESEMWYCNRCKKHVRAWKQFHIYRSPPILIVHLKRFQYSASTHRRDKIGVYIDFPLENLDLREHVMHWAEEDKPIYDCYAVSNHYGGLGGGHYTAYCLNDDGVWCHYDDSRITSHVDPKDVVSQAAYVLYYRRRDVPVGQDFALAYQTPGLGTPAIIQVEKGRDGDPSEVSSNAALVGEEETMEVDEADLTSRDTSPMGSEEGQNDRSFEDHDYVAEEPSRPVRVRTTRQRPLQ